MANVTRNDLKRNKNWNSPILEEGFYKWFLTAQEAKLAISDDLIINKAKAMHKTLYEKQPNKIKECRYTNSWLYGIKKEAQHLNAGAMRRGKLCRQMTKVGIKMQPSRPACHVMIQRTSLTWTRLGFSSRWHQTRHYVITS